MGLIGMENKILLEGKIGAEGSYKIETVNANVVATITYSGAELDASAVVTVKSKAGLESLKKLIPGTIDDAIINVIEAALGL